MPPRKRPRPKRRLTPSEDCGSTALVAFCQIVLFISVSANAVWFWSVLSKRNAHALGAPPVVTASGPSSASLPLGSQREIDVEQLPPFPAPAPSPVSPEAATSSHPELLFIPKNDSSLLEAFDLLFKPQNALLKWISDTHLTIGHIEENSSTAASPVDDVTSMHIPGKTKLSEEVSVPCVPKNLEGVRKHLHDIVLIINFSDNKTVAQSADLLKSVYGRFFKDTVLIGPDAMPEFGVEARGHGVPQTAWQFSYFRLPAIAARYPTAAGFLWTDDDVVLNYWNFLEADVTKVWLPTRGVLPEFVSFEDMLAKQGWSAKKVKVNSALEALHQLENKFVINYEDSIAPVQFGYPRHPVSCFYIPRRLVEALAFDLIPTFRDYMVWSELAIPIMIYSLERPGNFDGIFANISGPAMETARGNFTDQWDPMHGAFHPLSLASPEQRMLFLNALAAFDSCLETTIVGGQQASNGTV